MVEFNTLKVLEDGKLLVIKASMSSESYYDDMYITSIYIDTEDTFSTGTPSTKAVKVYSTSSKSVRSVSLNVLPAQLNLSNFDEHIMYVYVVCGGTPAADTPCGKDNIYNIGIAINWYLVYRKALQYIAAIGSDCCTDNKGFIDFILRCRALQLAASTGQYAYINEHFKKWIVGKGKVSRTPCGCGK